MLILIGTVPTAYALNHAVTAKDVQDFIAASDQAARSSTQHVDKNGILGRRRAHRSHQLHPHQAAAARHHPALRELVKDLEPRSRALQGIQGCSRQPADQRPQRHVRGQRSYPPDGRRATNPAFTPAETAALTNYKAKMDKATKFIPTWVKVAVALALGMGTMVGWKRIVVTVGEKIGKEHLTYAQGACAELVAMATISAADNFGLPVSTTHVLSSGVAGTMAANKSGLQLSTIRNIAAAWVFTLPVAALLSGTLFWLFRHVA